MLLGIESVGGEGGSQATAAQPSTAQHSKALQPCSQHPVLPCSQARKREHKEGIAQRSKKQAHAEPRALSRFRSERLPRLCNVYMVPVLGDVSSLEILNTCSNTHSTYTHRGDPVHRSAIAAQGETQATQGPQRETIFIRPPAGKEFWAKHDRGCR